MERISTGYKELDALLKGGLERKSLTLLAGRVSLGKTTFALNLASNVALGAASEPVLYFSNEDCRHSLTEKLISAATMVSLLDVMQAAYTGDKRLLLSAARLAKSELFIADGSWIPRQMTCIEGVCKGEIIPGAWGKTKRAVPGLIIVDHVLGVQDNRWASPPKFRSSRSHSRSVLAGLKALAEELNAAIVAIVPLRRTPGTLGRPQPEELKRIFGEETVSNRQLFLHGERTPAAHVMELFAAGSQGKTMLTYEPACALFSDSERPVSIS